METFFNRLFILAVLVVVHEVHGDIKSSPTDCHKLNVIHSNGSCPEEGRFIVPLNCTVYIDCMLNETGAINPHIFHCENGYFNGTNCNQLDAMISHCPQTDCFQQRSDDIEMLKSDAVNVTEMVTIDSTPLGTISDENATMNSSINHLDSTRTQLMSAIHVHRPMTESSTMNSSIDGLDSASTELMSAMHAHTDESLQNNTDNNKMNVSTMPTIKHLHHMNATSNTSVETSKMDNRQGRLIIKDMSMMNTTKSQPQGMLTSSTTKKGEHVTMVPEAKEVHHHDKNDVETAPAALQERSSLNEKHMDSKPAAVMAVSSEASCFPQGINVMSLVAVIVVLH